MSKYEAGETVGSGDAVLTITRVHSLPEGRTVQMYDVEFADGTTDTFSEGEVTEFVGK